MIPEKAQGKVVEATVVAVGGGRQMVSHIFYYLHTQQSITCRDLFRKWKILHCCRVSVDMGLCR